MHYYQFNIGDFLKDTAHLSLEEEAIYRRLIDLYYTSEKPISLDIQTVSRAIRARGSEELIAIILEEFFTKTSKGFKQTRIEKELKRFKEKSKKAADSAKARWNKASKVCDKDANAMRTHSEGNANHKPITNNHKPLYIIPDGINLNAWEEWENYRKSKKKKISKQAAAKQFKLLLKYPQNIQQTIIDNSITNDYQGLFEPKVNHGKAGSTEQIDNSAAGRVRAAVQQSRQNRGAMADDG